MVDEIGDVLVVEALFERAVELKNAEQIKALLEKECPNGAVRKKVMAMLDAQPDMGEFLTHTTRSTDLILNGTEIGPYKIREQIGEGGMGVVYVAEQEHPVRRKVALKVIKPGMDTKEVIARFEAERQALAVMDHPNIARVLEAGVTDERPYFVMELVRGIPIVEYCDRMKLSNAARLLLFRDVCHAVQHAHQKGIIHRDLKPSNILVTQIDGKPIPKVIDFGLAKATNGNRISDKTVYTGFMKLMGTPAYMSPEQVGVSGVDVDTRSDVYSLGAVLYELLTGRTPLDSNSLTSLPYDEVCRQIREVEVAKPSDHISTIRNAELSTIAEARSIDPVQLRSQLRGDLDWVLLKALDKDRNRRYESASALSQDIDNYLSNEPVSAVAPSPWYILRKYAQRHKVVIATFGLIWLTLTSATVFSLSAAYKAYQSGQVAMAKQRETDKANAELASAFEREQLTNYGYVLTMSLESLRRKQFRRTRELLASCPKKFRGWEWEHLWLRTEINEPEVLIEQSVPQNDIVTIPNRNRIVTATTQGVSVWNASNGELVEVLLDGDSASCLATSTCGRFIAAGLHSGRIIAWDAWSLEEHGSWEQGDPVVSIAISRDGDCVITGDKFGAVVKWIPQQDTPSHQTSVHPGLKPITSLSLTADDKHVLVGSWAQQVYVCNLEDLTLNTDRQLSAEGQDAEFIEASRDGRLWAAAGCLDHEHTTLFFWDSASQALKNRLKVTGHASAFHFSHDGGMFAVRGDTVQVYRTDGFELLSESADSVRCLRFGENGELFFGCDDGKLRRWNPTPRSSVMRWRHSTAALRDIAFSSSGSTVATGGKDGLVKLWDASTGREISNGRWPAATGAWSLALQFLQNDKTLLVGGRRDLLFYDVDSGELRNSIHGLAPWWVDISPDHQHIAAGGLFRGDKSLYLVDSQTQEVLRQAVNPHNSAIEGIAFSPSMSQPRVVTYGADGSLILWDSVELKQLCKRQASGQLDSNRPKNRNDRCVAFSPDGLLVACGRRDGTVELWKIEGDELTKHTQLSRHADGVSCLAFSPDQTRIYSGSRDGTIMVWTIDGKRLLTLITTPGGESIWNLEVSPDGKTLAAVDGAGYVTLWECERRSDEVYRRRALQKYVQSSNF